jgi:hypothetical protein
LSSWATIGIILIVANAIIFSSAEVSEFEKIILSVVLLLVLFCTIIFSFLQVFRRLFRCIERLTAIKKERRQKNSSNQFLKSIGGTLSKSEDKVESLRFMTVGTLHSTVSTTAQESHDLQMWRDAALNKLGPTMFAHVLEISLDIAKGRKVTALSRIHAKSIAAAETPIGRTLLGAKSEATQPESASAL